MGEKNYNYTTKNIQPQKVAGITLNNKAGVITERQLKALKKDPYGASLLEKGLLIIGDASSGETVPDFE